MACITTCVRKHIRKECAPLADIAEAWFVCPDDVTLTYAPDGGSPTLCSEGVVSNIVVDNGTDPDNAFHEFQFNTDGDSKGTLEWSAVVNDDGTEEKTSTAVLTIDDDNPEIRCFVENMLNVEHDWIFRYPGEDFPYEYAQGLKLTDAQYSSTTRAWTLTFTKTNPARWPKLIWDTDYATTQTMVNGVIAP